MSFINLTGVIVDPDGAYSVGDEFRFVHQTTTGSTIKGAISSFVVPLDGSYNIDLQYGNILIEYKPIETGSFEVQGIVTVNQDTLVTTLPELLNSTVPPTDSQILVFQQLVAQANAEADRAESEADRAEAAANSVVGFDPTSDQNITGNWDFGAVITKASSPVLAEDDIYGATNEIKVGSGAGQTNQGSQGVAVGLNAGQTDQGTEAIAIGGYAGNNTQSDNAVAIGKQAGRNTQGLNATAIGNQTGNQNQGVGATALGTIAGFSAQGDYSVAVGYQAGQTSQGTNAVAIGRECGAVGQGYRGTAVGVASGRNNQGEYAVALGYGAGYQDQGTKGIIINATGALLNDTSADHIHIKTPAGGFDFDGTTMDIVAPSGLTANGVRLATVDELGTTSPDIVNPNNNEILYQGTSDMFKLMMTSQDGSSPNDVTFMRAYRAPNSNVVNASLLYRDSVRLTTTDAGIDLTGSINYISDKNLKTNITPMSVSLDGLREASSDDLLATYTLNPKPRKEVKKRKEAKANKEKVKKVVESAESSKDEDLVMVEFPEQPIDNVSGLMAQALQNIVPCAVKTNDDGDLTVDMSAQAAGTLLALKQVLEMVDNQAAEIEALKKTIEGMNNG